MPPFGNLYDLPVYVDLPLGQNERIVSQAGTYSVTMSVAYDEFERLAAAAVADLAVVRSARPSAQRARIGQVRVRETPSTAWMLETTIRAELIKAVRLDPGDEVVRSRHDVGFGDPTHFADRSRDGRRSTTFTCTSTMASPSRTPMWMRALILDPGDREHKTV
jgi:hypothetical protein